MNLLLMKSLSVKVKGKFLCLLFNLILFWCYWLLFYFTLIIQIVNYDLKKDKGASIIIIICCAGLMRSILNQININFLTLIHVFTHFFFVRIYWLWLFDKFDYFRSNFNTFTFGQYLIHFQNCKKHKSLSQCCEC